MTHLRFFLFLLTLGSHCSADTERFAMQDINALTIISDDGTASLKVEIERFDPDELKIVEANNNLTVWHGKRELPLDVLGIPTMIKKLELVIDGKPVNIPKNFWNDIAGLKLKELWIDPKRPIKTPEDENERFRFLEQQGDAFPTISRTPGGSTVLISWIRPEE